TLLTTLTGPTASFVAPEDRNHAATSGPVLLARPGGRALRLARGDDGRPRAARPAAARPRPGPPRHRVAVQRLVGGQGCSRAEHGFVDLVGQVVFLVVEEARQAHVEDLDDAVAIDQDVARLDVAVDEPGRVVGVLQAEGRLADVMGGAQHVHRAGALDDLLQA